MLNSCGVCGREGLIVTTISPTGVKMYHGECTHCHAITRREYTERQAETAWNYGVSLMRIHEQIQSGIYSWKIQKIIDRLYGFTVQQKKDSECDNVKTSDIPYIVALCADKNSKFLSNWCKFWKHEDVMAIQNVVMNKFINNFVKNSYCVNKVQS